MPSLAQLKNLILPGVYKWQSEAPAGTALDVRHDVVNDVLLFYVGDEEVDRITHGDLADGWASRVQLTQHRLLARAWEKWQEDAPIRAAAIPRAEELLRRHLTEAQNKCLTEHGYIEVDGNKTGHVYRIFKETYTCAGRNVALLIGGQPIAFFGAKPMHGKTELPWGDVMLAQKLTLEADELEFQKVACVVGATSDAVVAGGRYAGRVVDRIIIDDPYGQFGEARVQLARNLAEANQLSASLMRQNIMPLPGSFMRVDAGRSRQLNFLDVLAGISVVLGGALIFLAVCRGVGWL